MLSEGKEAHLELATQNTRYKTWVYQQNWVLCQTRINGWVWGQRLQWNFEWQPHCTASCLDCSSPQSAGVIRVLWETNVELVRLEQKTPLFAQSSIIRYLWIVRQEQMTYFEQQILSHSFEFFIISILWFIGVGNVTFLKDVLIWENNWGSSSSESSSILNLNYWTTMAFFSSREGIVEIDEDQWLVKSGSISIPALLHRSARYSSLFLSTARCMEATRNHAQTVDFL